MSQSLRIVFAGTPAFAEAHLAALLNSRHEVCAVFTQPDRRAGRGKQLRPSPVKELALQQHIPVHQPTSLDNAEAQVLLRGLQADVMVVVAYGLLLPPAVLGLPALGCINVHASLLPRWRGAAPIERALLAGDERTGISIMQMDAGLDTGPVLCRGSIAISATENGAELTQRLTDLGCTLLVDTLDQLSAGQPVAEPQDERLSTYAAKLKKQEALINWDLSAIEIQRQIMALYPRMPAYAVLAGERVRMTRAEVVSAHKPAEIANKRPGEIIAATNDGLVIVCRNSLLRVSEVQLPGKNPVSIAQLLNARREQFAPGQCFTSEETQP